MGAVTLCRSVRRDQHEGAASQAKAAAGGLAHPPSSAASFGPGDAIFCHHVSSCSLGRESGHLAVRRGDRFSVDSGSLRVGFALPKLRSRVHACFLCPQHGTQWASSACVRCSCAHGKVSCAPSACPALACGPGELQYTARGSCCPACLGRGREYCLRAGRCRALSSAAVGKLFFSCSVPSGRQRPYFGD